MRMYSEYDWESNLFIH